LRAKLGLFGFGLRGGLAGFLRFGFGGGLVAGGLRGGGLRGLLLRYGGGGGLIGFLFLARGFGGGLLRFLLRRPWQLRLVREPDQLPGGA